MSAIETVQRVAKQIAVAIIGFSLGVIVMVQHEKHSILNHCLNGIHSVEQTSLVGIKEVEDHCTLKIQELEYTTWKGTITRCPYCQKIR